MEALIVVDMQNDFTSGGALAVDDGDAVIGPVNRLAAEVPLVVATRDWHPPDHGSFEVNGGIWPVHCVQGSRGAELHPDVDADQIDLVVDTGHTAGLEGYSGFEGTELEQLLRDHGVDKVHVVGLALDYCVKETALDAKRAGFDVVVHREGTRPVEVKPGDGKRAEQELVDAGVQVID
jgi:nicotinamidase/pyrazinamidase